MQLISQAVEAEFQDLLRAHAGRRTEEGKAGVVRNGYLPAREIQTGIGPVTVQIPKVRSKMGEPVFRSALVNHVPWLYLKGILHEAWQVLVGPDVYPV